jgi:hypothetical protein
MIIRDLDALCRAIEIGLRGAPHDPDVSVSAAAGGRQLLPDVEAMQFHITSR